MHVKKEGEMPCPFCGSTAQEYEKIEHEEVGWSDGLGSPGGFTYREIEWHCESCGAWFTPPKK